MVGLLTKQQLGSGSAPPGVPPSQPSRVASLSSKPRGTLTGALGNGRRWVTCFENPILRLHAELLASGSRNWRCYRPPPNPTPRAQRVDAERSQLRLHSLQVEERVSNFCACHRYILSTVQWVILPRFSFQRLLTEFETVAVLL